jgi:hypothetical protein
VALKGTWELGASFGQKKLHALFINAPVVLGILPSMRTRTVDDARDTLDHLGIECCWLVQVATHPLNVTWQVPSDCFWLLAREGSDFLAFADELLHYRLPDYSSCTNDEDSFIIQCARMLP